MNYCFSSRCLLYPFRRKIYLVKIRSSLLTSSPMFFLQKMCIEKTNIKRAYVFSSSKLLLIYQNFVKGEQLNSSFKEIVPVKLVFLFKAFFFALKVKSSKCQFKMSFGEIRPKTCIFGGFFLFAAQLPASLIIHIPISELHAQWHWCLHFNMSLNSERFPQFHPTVMLVPMVAYVNFSFILIRQNFFPVFFLAEPVNILVQPRAGFPSAVIFSHNTSLVKGHLRSYE